MRLKASTYTPTSRYSGEARGVRVCSRVFVCLPLAFHLSAHPWSCACTLRPHSLGPRLPLHEMVGRGFAFCSALGQKAWCRVELRSCMRGPPVCVCVAFVSACRSPSTTGRMLPKPGAALARSARSPWAPCLPLTGGQGFAFSPPRGKKLGAEWNCEAAATLLICSLGIPDSSPLHGIESSHRIFGFLGNKNFGHQIRARPE